MVVKWVCSACGSNNLQDYTPVMQCEVCGTFRSSEEISEVNSGVVDTSGVKKMKIDLSQGWESYMQIFNLGLAWYCKLVRPLMWIFVACGVALSAWSIYRSEVSVEAYMTSMLENNLILAEPQRYVDPLVNAADICVRNLLRTGEALGENLERITEFSPEQYVENMAAVPGSAFVKLANVGQNLQLQQEQISDFLETVNQEKNPQKAQHNLGMYNCSVSREPHNAFLCNLTGRLDGFLVNMEAYMETVSVNFQVFMEQAALKLSELTEHIMNKVREFL